MKSYVVFWKCGKWEFYLTAHHRVPFTFDESDAHHFDTFGHAYEAAILLERIHPHVTYVRESTKTDYAGE